jgi:CBS domain-containing protein
MTKTTLPKQKKIRTTAEDVMSSELVVLNQSNTYREAIELLTQKRLTVIPVVNATGKLLGLLTEKEILEACDSFALEKNNFLDKTIKYIENVQTAQLDTSIGEIKQILSTKSFRHLPIVDTTGYLRGIITRRDLIRVIYLRIELKQRKLTEAEGKQIVRGIEKVLANGKARIVIHFNTNQGAEAPGGVLFLEKGLEPLKALAIKMGGDIQFVVPESLRKNFPRAYSNLQTTIKSITGKVAHTFDKDALRAQVHHADPNSEVNLVRTENKYLVEKLRELLELVGQPSSDNELKTGLAHYRHLAAEVEASPPPEVAKK